MSLPSGMTIAEGARAIHSALDAWAATHEGQAMIVANIQHLWEIVAAPAPPTHRPRLAVMFNGEEPVGGYDAGNKTYRVKRNWQVVIIRGHGFKNLMAEAGDGGEPCAFFLALDKIRDVIRFCNVTMEPPVDYVSMRPYPNVAPPAVANVFIDAFSLEFSTVNDIPWSDAITV